MIKRFSGAILKWLGWKIEGKFPHHEPKLVIAVMHHTSNWDFPVGLLLRKYKEFNANFVMKANMFKPPFGFIFKWLGGHPVERNPGKKKFSLTDSIANLYIKEEKLIITFTPEGTRSKVRKLKTGFWTIAKKAQVPILYVDFDFGTKTIRFGESHMASVDFKTEYYKLKDFFQHSQGLIPEKSYDFEDNDMVFE